MARGQPVVAAAPKPLPRSVTKRGGADWRKRGAYLAAALCLVGVVVYLEVTKVPLPQSSAPPAATGRKQKIDWAELLGGLQQRKAADLGQLQGGLGSALDWSSQPAEARATALLHARDAVAHDELITRMTESRSPEESWGIALQIAPELRGAEDGSFDVPQLLHALLEGRENDGALPDVRGGAPGPGAPPSEVAAHQVELLRHAVRSGLLARFCGVALAALEHGARLDPSALQDGAEL